MDIRAARARPSRRWTSRLLRPAGCACFLLLLARPAAPSCQTPFCHQQYRTWEAQREARLEAELTADPREPGRWRELLELLDGKLRREIASARYEAMYRWEPQAFLEGDPARAVSKEREAWLHAWREAGAPAADAWCYEAGTEPDAAARVTLLRRASDELPDDATVQRCLVHALLDGNDVAGAVTAAAAYRDRRPGDRAAWDLVVETLQRAGEVETALAAEEERERRFPEPELRRQLLASYARNGRGEQRDRLLARIGAEDGLVGRWYACGALHSRRDPAAVGRCHRELFEDFEAAGELGNEERFARDSVRDSVLMQTIHARDWDGIRALLAAWPAESALRAWLQVADWLEAEGGCAELVGAFRRGRLAAALASDEGAPHARLAAGLRGCGETALAEEVGRSVVAAAEPSDMRRLGGGPAREELLRRLGRAPADPQLLEALADVESELPAARRVAHLEAWAAAAPDALEPALRLARLHEGEGQGAEAVRWLTEAATRAPEDVDLRLGVGATALRFRNHRAVEAAARQVLAGPASVRQHAEAHYLLGRVAIREGRREEAARELLLYFPLRLRYAGCRGEPECDRGLQLLLLGNGDPALGRYLAERAAAVEWFGERMLDAPAPGTHRLPAQVAAAWARRLEARPAPVPAELATGCRLVGTLERLAVAGPHVAPAAERSRRRRQVERAAPCPADWPTDLDSLFPDAMLLALGPELTRRD